jgi:hypothetical protein
MLLLLIFPPAASGWFFTHYGSEVPYSKNWVFPGDLLWYNRWTELLTLAPQFIEIVVCRLRLSILRIMQYADHEYIPGMTTAKVITQRL